MNERTNEPSYSPVASAFPISLVSNSRCFNDLKLPLASQFVNFPISVALVSFIKKYQVTLDLTYFSHR